MLLQPRLDSFIAPKHLVHKHALKDIVQMINPATGFIQNCNSTPYKVSGASSPFKMNYQNYILGVLVDSFFMYHSNGKINLQEWRD